MALSRRAEPLSQLATRLNPWDVLANLYDPVTNPTGYISLGLAENTLMHPELHEHLHSNFKLPLHELTYGDGKKNLRSVWASFLNRHFNPVKPIKAEHVTISNGCSSAVEHAAWAFCNPGESFLLGRPYYGVFNQDANVRMGAKLAHVSFGDLDPLSVEAIAKYEEELLRVKADGGKVSGLLISNPHNPLGRSYPRETLVAMMKLCQKYQIHLISDEIYALSVFENTVDGVTPTPFESVLSIDKTGIVDESLIHVLWGTSKDFGANGIRLGSLVSQGNEALQSALQPVSLYSSTSSLSDHAAINLLEDTEFTERYIRSNQAKLSECYTHITAWARRNDIHYAAGVNAGFFLWLDLGAIFRRFNPQLPAKGFDVNKVIADLLLRQKVFIGSGTTFGSEKPGWFRIVFSTNREYVDEGLRRIIKAVESHAEPELIQAALTNGQTTTNGYTSAVNGLSNTSTAASTSAHCVETHAKTNGHLTNGHTNGIAAGAQ
ncbi:hypothetical protein N3K66_005609 [Trichothecium roseum]|uniref:Uncharacterized protein n=1 Tax=Trichothecium roseum TaxID=47278 RepID=A0ACC0UZP9_9HYPO|nr:hypothetical protein N3K66_005609 [Trichothecium roseum]